MNLFIDTETLPTINQDFISQIDVSPPGNMKKQETIDKWLAENRETAHEDQLRKTALDSTKGRLLSIGWAFGDEDVNVIIDEDEHSLLTQWFDAVKPILKAGYLDNIVWIGHNIVRFDIPYLYHRSVVNGIRPALRIPVDAKPWSGDVFDTCLRWKLNSSASGSQQAIATALGIQTKTIMHGSEVYDFYKAGKLDVIKDYNAEDVETVREIYKRMTWGKK